MTHLSVEEFVDLIDGDLAEARQAHVRECGACRGQAASMGLVLARVGEDVVPEPSPLFWEHLSARVADAAAASETPSRAWRDWVSRPAAAWAAGLASVTLAVALSHAIRPSAVPQPNEFAPAAVPAPATRVTPDAPDDPDGDEAWALVRSMADGVDWDAAESAGISPRPGAVERFALGMSTREKSELARLLQDEMKRPGI